MDTSTPQIFSQEEWHRNNYKWFCQSNVSRCDWHKLREEATCTAKHRAALTKCLQDEVSHELAERSRDIYDRRTELSKHIDILTAEIHKLTAQKKRLENCLDSTQTALNISKECLNLRRQRIGSDIVEDDLQRCLLKEEDLLKEFQCKLQKTINEAESQLRRDLESKKCLEFDWSDKTDAYQIDVNSGHLTNCSTGGIAFYPGQEDLPERWSTTKSWADYSRDNLNCARQEINSTANLRCFIDEFIRDCAISLREQADMVDVSMSRRVIETADCLYRLTQHLDLTAKDISQAEETINFLKQELLEKEPSMKVAQTRLHCRNQRPNVELCKDPAQHSLIREVRELAVTVHKLRQGLELAESGLGNLLETRRGLETEAAVKQNTLLIDKERCNVIRQRYPPQHKLMGY